MGLVTGVIGCGNIARFHFAGLEKAGARVKWICDLDEAAARPWVERLGARFTTDYRELVADAEVDVIDVLTVSSAHKETCLAAIDAGKAVICEKTLAETADYALAIVRRAKEKRTIFYTAYMKRFIPAVEKAKELLPSLGRILTTHIRAHQPWGDVWDASPGDGAGGVPPTEMSDVRRRYGGGVLVCGGSHILDLVLFFLGRPTRLFAHFHVPEGRDHDLLAAALLETANGPVHYEALAHPLNRIGFLRDGWDERVEITGTRGRLEISSCFWDRVEHKASMLVHYRNATDNETDAATEYRYPPVSPFERELAFFCRNIDRGRQGGQSRLTGYEVDELIGCIMKSAAGGKAVDVEWRI